MTIQPQLYPQPSYHLEPGPLAVAYELFLPSTLNTGAQISADRIRDVDVRGVHCYSATLPLATKRGGKLLLGIGGNAAFTAVLGADPSSVCQQLMDRDYIHLSPEQRDMMLFLERSGEVTFVDPKDLKLRGSEAVYREFPIRTGAYEKDVTPARLPFVRAGYGSGDQLRQVMDNLKYEGEIAETRVITMSPEHTAESVADGEMIALLSGIQNFDANSNFDANNRLLQGYYVLRGIHRRGAQLTDIQYSPTENSLLESLTGKGSVAHGDLAVVRRTDVSSEAWHLLTQQ